MRLASFWPTPGARESAAAFPEAMEAVAKSEPPADAPVEDRVRLALGYFARARASGE